MEKPIALTMGEPAGIGAEITLRAWQSLHKISRPFFYIGSIKWLSAVAEKLGIETPLLQIKNPAEAASAFATRLPVFDMPLIAPAALGKADARNSKVAMAAIAYAVDFYGQGAVSAIVTNPIHKATMQQGGFEFPGHTEYLAYLAGKPGESIMMLQTAGLRVIPVTVHVPLKDVSSRLTTQRIVDVARIASAALKKDFGIASPRLAVAGLNPHAGESGTIGKEEADIIAPAIAALSHQGIAASGPYPADTLFHADARARYDAAVCMYHDQALIPLKTLDFWGGVNVTLGLPFIRTSPDHGTGLDIAAKGIARADSLVNALKAATQIAESRKHG